MFFSTSRNGVYSVNITLISPPSPMVGVYGRPSAPASVTRHAWSSYPKGGPISNSKQELARGLWYIALYLEGPSTLQFGIVVGEKGGTGNCEDCRNGGRLVKH